MTPSFSSTITATKCYQYASDVDGGVILAGKRVRQACRRFLEELERESDPDYPWRFDVERAYRPVRYIERYHIPTKGDYDKMALLPWQHFVEGNLYGWVDKKTGLRRFREGLIIVGSGNGKSTMIVGNATYGASSDGERGAEIYLLANSKEQAGVIFNECKAQVDESPALRKQFRNLRDGIYFDKTHSKIQPLATDSRKQEGRNVHLAVFDELQDYRDFKLINVIKAKTKKRRQPLVIYITTLGSEISGPLMDLYVLGGNVLDNSGVIPQRVSDRFFAYIAEIDEGDEPEDISCWYKANPSLGVLLKLNDVVDEWERCKLVPAERSNFINKQLNVFTSVDELSFLDVAVIRKNNRELPLERLAGKTCYGGFDLAETEDFTSACLEFPLEENKVFYLEHSWVPQKKVKQDSEKLDWAGLQQEGLLTVVPGEYVDYNLVFQWFETMKQRYVLDSVGYDPAKAFTLVQLMTGRGYRLEPVRQGELTLTGPLDDLKEKFLDGKVVHNNNRLFTWYLSNVKLSKRGPNATYLPTKQSKYRKIDGFAAALNAHTQYLRRAPTIIPPDKSVATVIRLN